MSQDTSKIKGMDRKGLSVFITDNSNDLIAGLTIAMQIVKAKKEGRIPLGKIAILSPNGYNGAKNKNLQIFKEEVMELGLIGILDKYSLMAESMLEETTNKDLVPTAYWEKIVRVTTPFETIIITDIIPFMNISSGYHYYDEELHFEKTINLIKSYANNINKKIIILVDKRKSISNYRAIIKSVIDAKFIFDYIVDNNSIKVSNSSYVESTPSEILSHDIKLKTIQKIVSSNDNKLIDIMTVKKRETLDMLTNGIINSMPLFKTGFSEIDRLLKGGLELGQVVSLTSDNEDMLTQFLLQVSMQSPIYFKTMFFNLIMNSRRLKEILKLKAETNTLLNIDRVQVLSIDTLEDNGDIGEIIEAIEHFIIEEDTRIFMINNDTMLGNAKSMLSTDTAELDSVYKKLQVVANKNDVLIIVGTIYDCLEDTKKPIPIEKTNYAINNIKTQIMISSKAGIKITKSLTQTKHIENSLLSLTIKKKDYSKRIEGK